MELWGQGHLGMELAHVSQLHIGFRIAFCIWFWLGSCTILLELRLAVSLFFAKHLVLEHFLGAYLSAQNRFA